MSEVVGFVEVKRQMNKLMGVGSEWKATSAEEVNK
jgi:hypothetical protein